MSTAAAAQTLDQKRAAHAWQSVEEAKKLAESDQADFRGHAKKLPMRIRAAGLGQALSFVNAKLADKDKAGLKLLLLTLNGWVLTERGLRGSADPTQPKALIEEICTRDAAYLKRATLEVMAYLQWLNRFTEAAALGGEAAVPGGDQGAE